MFINLYDILNDIINEGVDVSLSDKDSEMKQAFKDLDKQIYGDKSKEEIADLEKKYTDSFKYTAANGNITKPDIEAKVKGQLFTFGNAKISKDCIIVNMTSAMHCPSIKFCPIGPKACYAFSDEVKYPNTRARNGRNEMMFDQARENPAKWKYIFYMLEKYIIEVKNLGIPIKYMRLNESGDFKTAEDIKQFDEFAKYLKDKYDIITHAYTANEALKDAIAKVENININASISTINGNNVFRHFYGIPEAKIMQMADTPLKDIATPILQYNEKYGWYYKCPCDISGGKTCQDCKVCWLANSGVNENGEQIPKYSVLCAIHGGGKKNYNDERADIKRGLTLDSQKKNIKKMNRVARKSENNKGENV